MMKHQAFTLLRSDDIYIYYYVTYVCVCVRVFPLSFPSLVKDISRNGHIQREFVGAHQSFLTGGKFLGTRRIG